MKPRLFLTGPIGCGKSTILEKALGERICHCGGFLTRRHPGEPLFFTLESPDGCRTEIFLAFSEGKPQLNMAAFSGLGICLLEGPILVLDEIGGAELLCPEFMAALKKLLQSNCPILGVMKGPGPANALAHALGLSEEYARAAECLRNWLREDENTLLYECSQFDAHALHLAEQWVKEYAHA